MATDCAMSPFATAGLFSEIRGYGCEADTLNRHTLNIIAYHHFKRQTATKAKGVFYLSVDPLQIDALVALLYIDLSDLDSVHAFVAELCTMTQKVDILVNNAGVMHVACKRTKQGFEPHIGVNYLGHYALTGQFDVNVCRVHL